MAIKRFFSYQSNSDKAALQGIEKVSYGIGFPFAFILAWRIYNFSPYEHQRLLPFDYFNDFSTGHVPFAILKSVWAAALGSLGFLGKFFLQEERKGFIETFFDVNPLIAPISYPLGIVTIMAIPLGLPLYAAGALTYRTVRGLYRYCTTSRAAVAEANRRMEPMSEVQLKGKEERLAFMQTALESLRWKTSETTRLLNVREQMLEQYYLTPERERRRAEEVAKATKKAYAIRRKELSREQREKRWKEAEEIKLLLAKAKIVAMDRESVREQRRDFIDRIQAEQEVAEIAPPITETVDPIFGVYLNRMSREGLQALDNAIRRDRSQIDRLPDDDEAKIFWDAIHLFNSGLTADAKRRVARELPAHIELLGRPPLLVVAPDADQVQQLHQQ